MFVNIVKVLGSFNDCFDCLKVALVHDVSACGCVGTAVGCVKCDLTFYADRSNFLR